MVDPLELPAAVKVVSRKKDLDFEDYRQETLVVSALLLVGEVRSHPS